MDGIDCGNFFDEIEDLIEFPPDPENGKLVSYNKDFPTWDEALQYCAFSFSFSTGTSSVPDAMPLEWLDDPFPDNNKQTSCSTPDSSLLESSSSSSSSSTQRARTKRPRPAKKIQKPNQVEKKIKVTLSTEAAVRKCLHCEITRTPQWRAGPMGPKTLCNACGVRFKSGRLFPEYRPAASPTFIPALHSNSHKKILHMRASASASASASTTTKSPTDADKVTNASI